MKVILLQDVKNVGKKNQIIEVSDGYGSNFLIPRKLAVRYSEHGVEVRDKQIQQEKDEFTRKQNEAKEVKRFETLPSLLVESTGTNSPLFCFSIAVTISISAKISPFIAMPLSLVSLREGIYKIPAAFSSSLPPALTTA